MPEEKDSWRERAEVAEQRAQVSEQRADASDNRADASEKRADAQELRISAGVVNVEAGAANLIAARDAMQAVSVEIADLRDTLENNFADRREVTRRRRGSLFVLGLVLFGFIQGHDLHVEECGPGARTEQLVEVFISEPLPAETLAQRMRDAVEPPEVLCDVSFPTHGHGRPDPLGQIVGISIYSAAVLAAFVWYRQAVKDSPR